MIRGQRVERVGRLRNSADARRPRDLIQRIEHGDPRRGIGAAFEAAIVVGVALFDRIRVGWAATSPTKTAKLRLLPKAVHKKREIVDDF